MRSITLRPGESFTTGDTSVNAEPALSNDVTRQKRAPSNPYAAMSDRQWLADYEREERRLAGRGGCA